MKKIISLIPPQPVANVVIKIAAALIDIYEPSQASQVAWWLLEELTSTSQLHLLAKKELFLSIEQQQRLQEWLVRLTQEHEPLAYILGWVPFAGLKIRVEPPTLIPRLETEEWALWLLEKLHTVSSKSVRILDMCTGSGAIGLALAAHLPNAQVIGIDYALAALKLAEKNKKKLGINNFCLLKSDLFEALSDEVRFDLIVANPPYVTQQEWCELDVAVRDWEDRLALVADNEGLAILEKIIRQAPYYLQESCLRDDSEVPQLVVEIGYKQGDHVRQLMLSAGFQKAVVYQDAAGKDRWVTGFLPARRSSEVKKRSNSYHDGHPRSDDEFGGVQS